MHAIGKRKKSVSKSSGNVNLIVALRGKDDAHPFSKIRRAMSNIHGDIQRFAFDYAANLGLRMAKLVMKSTQGPLDGTGMIILNKCLRDAEFGELSLMVGLQEKAASIAENRGSQFEHAGKRCQYSLQWIQDLG